MIFFFTLVCCLFSCFTTIAQTSEQTITYNTKDGILPIGRHVYLLEDKTARLTLEDIQKPTYQKLFKKPTQEIPNFNTTRSRIWVKMTVANQTGEKIYLEVAQALAWYLDFYKPDTTGQLVLTSQTGIMRPMKNREIDNNFFLFELANNPKPQTYYFSIQSDFPVTLPLSLASKDAQIVKITYYSLFFGGFSGLVLIMFFHNLFVAYSVRDKLYLYYCAYLLISLSWVNFISGNFGYKFNPIFYVPSYLLVFTSLNVVSVVIFIIHLLQVSKKQTFYKISSFLVLLYFLGSMFNIITGHYIEIIDFLTFISLLVSAYTLFYAIRLYLHGNYQARFVVYGFSFYLIAIIIYAIQKFDLISSNFFTAHAVVFGSSMEILMFSLALADRINILRREKEASQKSLLTKTLENEKLLSQQNQLLEAQVQERTEELQTINEELNANVEELSITLELLDRQKQTIEFINHKMTSSIKYAQTIQEAILPTAKELQTYLKDYFLVYRPKDVVSGDFYWIHTLPDSLVVVVADCTGHGVAGSFMSLIGIKLLDNMLVNMGHLTPAQIIYELNASVRKTLKQNERLSFNEGMDMAVCKIYHNTHDKVRLEFAGSKRPLYYINQNEHTLKTIQGDRKSVGNDTYPPYVFTHHEFMLTKGDMLYMCSDGFVDQNNPQRKKFGEKTLHNLLLGCCDKPTETQQNILTEALDIHQQNVEQRDDITLLGIRLT